MKLEFSEQNEQKEMADSFTSKRFDDFRRL